MALWKKKYQKLSDEEVLNLFVAKPMVAIEELYKRYSVLCYGLAIKYLKNRQEAKDAVNDVFIRLRFDLEKHEVKNFKSWFYTYSKNHFLGILRKNKRTNSFEDLSYGSELITEIIEDNREEELNLLEKAMEDLKAPQLKCIKAYYFKRQSYEDIALELQIQVKQVKSHLQNGKRNLRNMLNQKYNSNQGLK